MSEQNKTPILSDAKFISGLYYLSGQIGVDPGSGEFAGTGIKQQAEQAAVNIESVLKKYGMGMENVLKANCYISDMENYADFNEIYVQHFISCPARTCVAVKSLPFGALCEIEVVASKEQAL